MNSFTINENYFNDQIVAFYLGAIDMASGSSDILFFDYEISSTDPDCYSGSEELIMQFSIKIYSPDMGFNAFQEFLKGTIQFTNIIGPLRFKNTDINSKTKSVSGAAFELSEYSGPEDITDPDYQTIVSTLMQSGKIPDGNYIFDFQIFAPDGTTLIDQITKKIDAYQPHFLNLISPGGHVSDTLSTFVFTTYPVFSWDKDDCSTCTLGIRVCEYNPLYHASPLDALSGSSALPLDQSKEYYSIPKTTYTFQYPISGSESLIPGKYYAWQLKRKFETTVGQDALYSSINVFKVHSFESAAASTTNLDIIKSIVGDEQYRTLFGVNGELSEYNQDITTIILDGNDISLSQLYKILSRLENGEITIKEVSTE